MTGCSHLAFQQGTYMKKATLILIGASICGLIMNPLWTLINELNLHGNRFYPLLKYFSYSLSWFTNVTIIAFFVELYNHINFINQKDHPLKTQTGLLHGRVTRREYWQMGGRTYLISVIIGTFLILTSCLLFRLQDDFMRDYTWGYVCLTLGVIPIICGWIIMVPVTVRRLHDVDMSGWWVLWFLLVYGVPVLGQIAFVFKWVIIGFGNGTRGDNAYGMDSDVSRRVGPCYDEKEMENIS